MSESEENGVRPEQRLYGHDLVQLGQLTQKFKEGVTTVVGDLFVNVGRVEVRSIHGYRLGWFTVDDDQVVFELDVFEFRS